MNKEIMKYKLNKFFKKRLQFHCWFSKKFFDIHDFYISKGGDGIPCHFHEYTCHNCGKKFYI